MMQKRQQGRRDPAVVSRNMSRIRATNTGIEIMVRSRLWRMGYRFRKNYGKLPGKPDIVFLAQRVAVFCDSDFWHGRNWRALKKRLRTNPAYWIPKLKRNRQRDRTVNRVLRNMGWSVLRFWESDIKADPDECVAGIVAVLNAEDVIRE